MESQLRILAEMRVILDDGKSLAGSGYLAKTKNASMGRPQFGSIRMSVFMTRFLNSIDRVK